MDLSMTALGNLRANAVLWVMIYVLLNPLFTMSQMNQEMYGATGKVGNKTYYRRDGKTIARIVVTPKNPKTDAQTIVDRMKAEKKILIKSYAGVGRFGTCLRVSIGERKYMERFTEALAELDR